MGFGKAFKKAVSQVSNTVTKAAEQTGREYDRYSSSTVGAYLTPYASLYTDGGRDALRKSYGGWASAGASAYNPALGAAVNAGLGVYDAQNQSSSSGSVFSPVSTAPALPAEVAAKKKNSTALLILLAVGVVAVGAGAVVYLRK